MARTATAWRDFALISTCSDWIWASATYAVYFAAMQGLFDLGLAIADALEHPFAHRQSAWLDLDLVIDIAGDVGHPHRFELASDDDPSRPTVRRLSSMTSSSAPNRCGQA